ncbi:MAG TPA: Uma2 family endonuclease [Candidatus Dormibacteraeota bacterium]|nr:Uma2 family endonuclease [Candidatus Dormibacteraeota bacterium]
MYNEFSNKNEILSPSSLNKDKIDKLKSYAHFKIPEYWIVDPNLGTLEQYVLSGERYDLIDIFQEKDQVISPNIDCISFTMKEIIDGIPELEYIQMKNQFIC